MKGHAMNKCVKCNSERNVDRTGLCHACWKADRDHKSQRYYTLLAFDSHADKAKRWKIHFGSYNSDDVMKQLLDIIAHNKTGRIIVTGGEQAEITERVKQVNHVHHQR